MRIHFGNEEMEMGGIQDTWAIGCLKLNKVVPEVKYLEIWINSI